MDLGHGIKKTIWIYFKTLRQLAKQLGAGYAQFDVRNWPSHWKLFLNAQDIILLFAVTKRIRILYVFGLNVPPPPLSFGAFESNAHEGQELWQQPDSVPADKIRASPHSTAPSWPEHSPCVLSGVKNYPDTTRWSGFNSFLNVSKGNILIILITYFLGALWLCLSQVPLPSLAMIQQRQPLCC